MNDAEENALESGEAPRKKSMLGRSNKSSDDHAGCASCALGRGADSLAALALASVALLLAARRRRR